MSDAPCYYTWVWRDPNTKGQDGGESEISSSTEQFAYEKACWEDGESVKPPHRLIDSDGNLNGAAPTLNVIRHEIPMLTVELGRGKRLSVTLYQRKIRVDIRKYEAVAGVMLRTRKGLSMPVEHWLGLVELKQDIATHLTAIADKTRDVDIKLCFGENLFASMKSPYLNIDLRTWWKPTSDELKPSTRGVNLSIAEWQVLLSNAPRVEDALTKLGTITGVSY